MYSNYKKELMVIGIMRMGIAHNAENIKLRIEDMINYYQTFDKKKIHCNKHIILFLNIY